jgi:addiction module HigA family antidote
MYNPPHPGEVLKEVYVDPLGLTITDTAKALGVTRQTLSELIHCHIGISIDMSLRLSKAFSTSPELWLNLQNKHDLWEAKRKASKLKVKLLYAVTKLNAGEKSGKPATAH